MHRSATDTVRSHWEKKSNIHVGLNLGFPCFFVGFSLISKFGKNAKYPILGFFINQNWKIGENHNWKRYYPNSQHYIPSVGFLQIQIWIYVITCQYSIDNQLCQLNNPGLDYRIIYLKLDCHSNNQTWEIREIHNSKRDYPISLLYEQFGF